MKTIIHKHVSLLEGLLFDRVEFDQDYIIAQSFIQQDKDWNQIIPLVRHNEIDTTELQEFIEAREAEGWSFSYYLADELKDSYNGLLESGKYSYYVTDTYLTSELTDRFPVTLKPGETFSELVAEDLEQYITLNIVAFSTWSNAEEYSRKLYERGREVQGKQLRTFVIKNGAEIICFGSVVYSVKDRIAYMHNSATNEKFKRQGYFTALKKSMLNFLLDEGITQVYVIVEEGGASHQGFARLGFEASEQYHIFSK